MSQGEAQFFFNQLLDGIVSRDFFFLFLSLLRDFLLGVPSFTGNHTPGY